MEITVHSINMIVSNPKIRSGRPIIAGTTLIVMDVVIAHVYYGKDAGGIAEWYGISVAQAHAALAYYYGNKDEIDEAIRQNRQAIEKLKTQYFDNNQLLS